MNRASEVAILTTATSEFEAGVIVAALREEGIEAHYFLGGIHYYMGSVASSILSMVQIVVPRRDLEPAKVVLAGRRSDSTTIDWSEVDVGVGESPAPPDRKRRRLRDRIFTVFAIALLVWIAIGILSDLHPHLEPGGFIFSF